MRRRAFAFAIPVIVINILTSSANFGLNQFFSQVSFHSNVCLIEQGGSKMDQHRRRNHEFGERHFGRRRKIVFESLIYS